MVAHTTMWNVKRLCRVSILAFVSVTVGASSQEVNSDRLANNVVLIVRHAEKPDSGRGLTPRGEARARAYASYFEPFHEGAWKLKVDALYAGSDSHGSVRPRLTLEPISKATGLELDSSIDTKEPDRLVTLLRTQQHGTHPLIAWRHGQIPALLQAFGASPTLLPNNKWPDETYDWVLVLQFGPRGRLLKQELVVEHLLLP